MRHYKGYFIVMLAIAAIAIDSVYFGGAGGCGCGTNGGAPAGLVTPTVSTTIPANGDTDVFVNRAVAATFSEEMAPETLTNTTFTLMLGATPVSGTVTYANFVATFTPATNLIASTEYTATITTGATNLVGIALASDYVWTFTTGTTEDAVPPTVSFTNPVDLATDVSINRTIAATFSEGMDPLTLATPATTFQVTGPGATPVTGTIVYTLVGNVATFTPDSNLAIDTTFTVTITTGAKDLAGNAMVADYVWTFTTGATADTTSPTVLSEDPADLVGDVAINKKMAVAFSEGMYAPSITPLTFLVTGPGTTSVAGTVDYALAGSIATFTPGSDLAPNTTFTATITTGVQDLAGNALASDFVWTFTTGATSDTTAPSVTSTNPADADTDVAINRVIDATFSEKMDPVTLTTPGNFALTGPGLTPVAGVVTYDLVTDVATFTLTPGGTNLAPNTTYTATITTAAKDLAGNPLASNYVWSFMTGTGAFRIGSAQESVPLGSAAPFAILAKAGVTVDAAAHITGNVGLSPDTGANLIGFTDPLCPEVTGTIYKVDAGGPACATELSAPPSLISIAQDDSVAAYNNAVAGARGAPQAISGNLAGLTLYPGLYESSDTILIAVDGILTLDAQGDPNAVFIIKGTSDMTTSTSSQVVLAKLAQAKNVFWTTATQTTLGVTSIMKGTIIAGSAITLLDHANLDGRALGGTEAITCNSCTIVLPSP